MGGVLFLAHRVPYPPDRGDKIRGFHILKYLAARRRVRLIAFADDPRDLQPKAALTALTPDPQLLWRGKPRSRAAIEALVGRKPLSLTAFDDKAMRAAVDAALADPAIGTIYVFSGQMAQYLPAETRQRVIMDFVDMDSAKFAAYARSGAGPMAWLMKREARLLLGFEDAVARRADASLFVSADEAALFRARTGAGRVHVIENGIDTDHYDPAAAFQRLAPMRSLIVFTGQMDYRPNVEAVSWFAHAILPQIRERHPQVRFAIVGRAPTASVGALARLPGVTVTGEVADVRGWLSAASVVVAPLKLARGIQNKVLEAMAMARPVVASRAAAEGIDHCGMIRIGDTAEEIAREAVALLEEPQAANALGRAARDHVQRRYGWAARLEPLDAILGADRIANRFAA